MPSELARILVFVLVFSLAGFISRLVTALATLRRARRRLEVIDCVLALMRDLAEDALPTEERIEESPLWAIEEELLEQIRAALEAVTGNGPEWSDAIVVRGIQRKQRPKDPLESVLFDAACLATEIGRGRAALRVTLANLAYAVPTALEELDREPARSDADVLLALSRRFGAHDRAKSARVRVS